LLGVTDIYVIYNIKCAENYEWIRNETYENNEKEEEKPTICGRGVQNHNDDLLDTKNLNEKLFRL